MRSMELNPQPFVNANALRGKLRFASLAPYILMGWPWLQDLEHGQYLQSLVYFTDAEMEIEDLKSMQKILDQLKF